MRKSVFSEFTQMLLTHGRVSLSVITPPLLKSSVKKMHQCANNESMNADASYAEGAIVFDVQVPLAERQTVVGVVRVEVD